MTFLTLSWISTLFFFSFFAADSSIESNVYQWDSLQTKHTRYGDNSPILHGKTTVFKELEIHATTLKPGIKKYTDSKFNDYEKLIIVKEGQMEMTLNNDTKKLSTGSVSLIMPGDKYNLANNSNAPVTIYFFSWKTEAFSEAKSGASSIMVDWDKVPFTTTSKGGKRQLLNHQTAMFDEFEMHTTMLNKGMKSHDQHTHIDEEIILIIRGQAEELIDGKPHTAKAGDLIFLQSNIPHGIRNSGSGPCEYFAFKWINK